MSDYIKLTRGGNRAYFHAWRVNGVFDQPDSFGSMVLTSGGSYDVDENAEDIIAMLDEVVNGPSGGPVVVPNFPGMEQ